MRRLTPMTLASMMSLLGACSSEDVPPDGGSPSGIELLRPTADEVITIGTRQPIRWSPPVGVDSVDIVLTRPDGGDEIIASDVDNGGSYDWQVPLLHSDTPRDYRIDVVASGAPAAGAMGEAKHALTAEETVAVGSLAGFKWSGTEEEYYWVDLVTGDSTTVGIVGDMKVWEYKGGATFDAANGIAYVVASPDDALSTWKLYSLDAATGDLLSDVAIAGDKPSVLQVNGQGEVLGFRWNGSAEEVVVIDTATGMQSVRGTVGDLAVWSLEAALDVNTDRLYALGADSASTWKVYTVDAVSGDLVTAQPLGMSGENTGISGLAVNNAGVLVGFRWNGSEEEMVTIDPETGAIAVAGIVGDLATWSGFSSINPSSGEIYVFGMDASDQRKLYTMDTATGTLLYDLPVTDWPTTTILVY